MVWLLAFALCVAGTVPLIAALLQQGASTADVVTEYFDQGHITRPDRLVSIEGFTAGDFGWYLGPGTSGSLVYRIPRQAGTRIGVHVWVYAGPGVSNAVIASAPGGLSLTLLTDVNGADVNVPLPPALDAAPAVDVEIRATNSSAAQVLVVDQLVTYVASGSPAHSPPVLTYTAFGGLVALVYLAWLRGRRHGWAQAASIGLVVAAATATRCIELFSTTSLLDPDAVVYRIYADRFQWWPFAEFGFFSGNFSEREPMFPMVVHGFFQLFGSSDFHLRVVSVTLSIAVVVLSIAAAQRRLLFWPGAMLVGLLLAVSGPLINESVRGLRLELEMTILLVLYIALDRGPSRRPWLDALVVGAIGAAMVLTRTYYLPVFVVAVLLSFVVRYRPTWRTLGLVSVALAIMLAAESAHRVGLYIHHGDAFYDTAGYNRWNANIERFALNRPLPHPELFPSAQEYQQYGPYFGPKLSTYQYLFVIHSPLALVRDSLAGSRQIFNTVEAASVMVQKANHYQALHGALPALTAAAGVVDLLTRWLVLLGIVALVAAAVRRPLLALIPLMVLSWVGLTAFLFDLGLLERYRHTWQPIPLAFIAAVWLLQSAFLAIARRRSRQDEALTSSGAAFPPTAPASGGEKRP